MTDLMKKLQKPLNANEIDFRVQSINRGGYATILAYKNARADMQRLDDTFTPLGWKREHLNGNANCIVSVYNDKISQWVSKEDTGVESNAEAKKGLASDSFKRACFNWGIGRELYDYPVISVPLTQNNQDPKKGEWYLEGNKAKSGWGLKLKSWYWNTQFDDNGNITFIGARDENGKNRFTWGKYIQAKPTLNSIEVDCLLDKYIEGINEAKDEQSLLDIARAAYQAMRVHGSDYAEKIIKAKDDRLIEVDIINKQADEEG